MGLSTRCTDVDTLHVRYRKTPRHPSGTPRVVVRSGFLRKTCDSCREDTLPLGIRIAEYNRCGILQPQTPLGATMSHTTRACFLGTWSRLLALGRCAFTRILVILGLRWEKQTAERSSHLQAQ